MPGVHDYMEVFERLESAHLSVDSSACLHVRNRNVVCERCAKACPSSCISMDDQDLAVDPSLCIGCGTCTTACLVGALVPHEPDDNELISRMLNAASACEGLLVVACTRLLEKVAGRYNPSRVVGVTCLGRIDESHLCSAAAHGVKRILLASTLCSSCNYELGLVSACCVASTANALFETWKNPCRVSVSDKLPSKIRLQDEDFDEGRREFFAAMRDNAKGAIDVVGTYSQEKIVGPLPQAGQRLQVSEDGTLPHRLPAKRARLLNSLKALGKPQDACIDTRLWGKVEIDVDMCSSCYMCAVFCPSGALLKVFHDGKADGLAHRPAACVKCRTCESICPSDALQVKAAVPAHDIASGSIEIFSIGKEEHPEDNPDSLYGKMASLMDFGNSRDLGSSL